MLYSDLVYRRYDYTAQSCTCCKSRITRVIYDLNHFNCAYKTAGYSCKFVYKTVSIQRSFVFASGTPTPVVVDIFGESINLVNKYSAFRCKSGYKSKGCVQGHNSLFTLIQFMTRICALNGRKLSLAKTMCHVPSSHTRALHTIVGGYGLHCRRCNCKVTYSLRCGQTAMQFGKTGGTAPGFRRRLHRWSETTSFRFFSRSVAIHTFTHDVRRI